LAVRQFYPEKNIGDMMNNVFGISIVCLFSVFIGGCANKSEGKPYKGAEVYSLSQNDIKYGKIEVRMMAAKGSGIINALFTWKEGSQNSDVFWEEVDVEVFGKNNATTWQSNVISGYDPRSHSEQVHQQDESLGDGFHTYSIEWTPESISWYFDGQHVRTITGTRVTDINSPAGIRFNIWPSTIPTWAGSWDDIVLPQSLFVNWVKYYNYEDSEFILNWTDEFDGFDGSRWGKADWSFDSNRADFEPRNVVVQDGMLILSLTKSEETGFSGIVPQDPVGKK